MKGNFRCISVVCLLVSGLNNIYHWKAHLLIVFESLLSSVSEKVSSLTCEKSDLPSANILHIDSIPLGKSIEEIPTQSPVELQPAHFSREKFDYLKQPFVDDLLSSFPLILKILNFY